MSIFEWCLGYFVNYVTRHWFSDVKFVLMGPYNMLHFFTTEGDSFSNDLENQHHHFFFFKWGVEHPNIPAFGLLIGESISISCAATERPNWRFQKRPTGSIGRFYTCTRTGGAVRGVCWASPPPSVTGVEAMDVVVFFLDFFLVIGNSRFSDDFIDWFPLEASQSHAQLGDFRKNL